MEYKVWGNILGISRVSGCEGVLNARQVKGYC